MTASIYAFSRLGFVRSKENLQCEVLLNEWPVRIIASLYCELRDVLGSDFSIIRAIRQSQIRRRPHTAAAKKVV